MEHWRKKKKIIGERANSGEFRKNKKREIEIEKRSTTVALTFKKCECWTYMINTLLFIL